VREEKEFVFTLDELVVRAEAKCQNKECGLGSITFDFNKSSHPETKCSECGKPLVTGLFPMIDVWYEFCRKAKASGAEIQFHVKYSEPPKGSG
jgi:hypothetical protein